MNGNNQLHQLLKSHFGYDHFLPLQEEIIFHLLQKKDALVLMPTGGGKSLCYQLPALCLPGITVVVSPLIALMKDQVDSLQANGIAAAFINSTLSLPEIEDVQDQARKGRLKILYVAPERLAFPGFRNFLHTLNVSLIAIDEAHCISEWGHDFRPEYRNLKTVRYDFPAAPIIALTATATERVRGDILGQLELRQPRIFLASFNRANLTYLVQPKKDSFEALLDLARKHKNEAAIVYCFSRKETESVAAGLAEAGLNALPYHAGLENIVRRDTQERFIRDEVSIIVATIAFGMGIDKPDIRLVVHYDLPKSLEGYYQETGRAGRDGLPSDCVLFYSYGDKMKQDFFIDQMEDHTQQEHARQKLARLIEFCELHSCRRRLLLEYFGEDRHLDSCNGCDVCLRPKEQVDATIIGQKILSAVIRTGERFGVNYVIEVLRGSKSKKVLEMGHGRLTVYGIAADSTEDDLKQMVGLLVGKGLLQKSGDKYPTLTVTPAGRTFLQRRAHLRLERPKPEVGMETASRARELPFHEPLYGELRALRKELADSQEVPPYVVFGDASLQQMAFYLPQTRESFSRTPGVGTRKLEQFSEAFLSVICRYARQHGLPERNMPARRRDRTSTALRAESTYDETKKLFLQGVPLPEIAQQRGLSQNAIVNHLARLVMAGEKLDFRHLMPPADRFDKIKAAFSTCGSEYLAPVRQFLGEEFSYEELALVRLHLRQGVQHSG